MRLQQLLDQIAKDVNERLLGLTAPESADEQELWVLLEESVPGRAALRVFGAYERAAPGSRAAGVGRAAAAAWRRRSPLVRMRAAGAIAVAAAATHVGLIIMTGAPLGAWWLILPGIAATFGAAALVLAWLGPRVDRNA